MHLFFTAVCTTDKRFGILYFRKPLKHMLFSYAYKTFILKQNTTISFRQCPLFYYFISTFKRSISAKLYALFILRKDL